MDQHTTTRATGSELGAAIIKQFRTNMEAEACAPSHTQQLIDGSVARSATRHFKYVAGKMTRRNRTVYRGVVQVAGAGAKKQTPYGDTQAEAANMVSGYIGSEVKVIKLNKSKRETLEESAERLAVLSGLLAG